MNDQQLATILEEALQRGRYERDDLYLFPIKLAWRMTNEAHVRDPERSIVFAAIEAHPDLAPILGMYLNTGLNAPQLTAPALGDWLLTRAMHMGAEEAVAELRSFIDAPHCDVDECFAFSGLQVSSPFSVASGLDLVPIESLPESELTISLSDPEWFYFGRDAGGRVRRKVPQVLASFGKSIWHVNPHVATAALKIQHKRTPKLLGAATDIETSQERLVEILSVLAAATCAAMFPVAHWVSASPTTPLWSGFGWTSWRHIEAIRPFASTGGHEARIAAVVQAWDRFPAELKPKLKVPLERFNKCLGTTSVVDCAIDMGLALEALLLADLGPNDQISLAFRLRGAWLLGRDVAERKKLVQHFNAVYKCRSTAVHGGTMTSDKFPTDTGNVSAYEFLMTHARPLAARAILSVIERGSIPEWGALTIGAELRASG